MSIEFERQREEGYPTAYEVRLVGSWGNLALDVSPTSWRLKHKWIRLYDPPAVPAPVRMRITRCGPFGMIWVPAHTVSIWPPMEDWG